MAKIDDGGPAFPMTAVYDQEGRGIMEGTSGMMLRDWFAGQALAGICANINSYEDTIAPPGEDVVLDIDVARAAYEYADAMIAARKAR